ncbi:MAG: tyrosine-protein phosphatase [Kiritimatiellae bacterium]|nr:tyrosine-protein phosphatase [Kiritimatiellia bacterium]
MTNFSTATISAALAVAVAASVSGVQAAGVQSRTPGLRVPSLNPAQAVFLAIPRPMRETLFDDGHFRATLARAGDAPPGATVSFPSLTNGTVGAVHLTLRLDGRGEPVFDGDVQGGSWTLRNPEIARHYTWSASSPLGRVDGDFHTSPEPPRLVKIPGVPNVRDLGGWIGLDGRRVRQGMAFRSAGLNDNPDFLSVTGSDGKAVQLGWGHWEKKAGKSRLTPETCFYVTNTLGVRTDLDLRSAGEVADMTGSPAGPSVKWVHVSSSGYADIFTKWGRESFARCFRLFLDERNYPIVFHCIGGQDRTGTLAMVLNGVLGVSEEDLCKDWMATAFQNPEIGWFNYSKRYAPCLERFRKERGSTFTEKAELYILSCGFTRSDIERFRSIMLESAP